MEKLVVDVDFYRNVYGGTLPEGMFDQAVGSATEVVLALLCPRVPAGLSPVEEKAAKLAVCAQMESGLRSPVASEDVGQFRTTLAGGMMRTQGVPVAAGTAAYLRQAGLLECWL